MKPHLTLEEKKQKIKEYKRIEYLKNSESIKQKQREYYYRKKKELGLPDKKDKYKISILRYNDNLPEDVKKKFIVNFD